MQTVKVWINHSPIKFDGFQPGDPLELALEFEASDDDSWLEICEVTFVALNGEGYAFGTLSQASIDAYHKQFPSLSVGDVVQVGDERFSCERVGWNKIESDYLGLGICKICKHQRQIFAPLEICSDCMQGDPLADLGLEG